MEFTTGAVQRIIRQRVCGKALREARIRLSAQEVLSTRRVRLSKVKVSSGQEGVTRRQFQRELLEDLDGIVPLLRFQLLHTCDVQGLVVLVLSQVERPHARGERDQSRNCNERVL